MKYDLPIPRAALDQHVILLGKTRSGKSSALRKISEVLLDEKKRTCIVTPKDDWWGLKLGADGKSPGCPVVIFGGKHADVPITEHAGEQIAKLVATGNRPCVIVLAGLSHRARTKFFIDFADALFRLNEGSIYLIIDECHNFAPKGRVSDFEQGEMLHWACRLASEGLGMGIMLLSASQRPQKVHNDYLTSHETLLAKRVIHKADRDAIKDWVDGCGDPSIGKKMVDELAGLARSQAYAWSPEIGFGPELVEIPFFNTYDSFKVQKPGSAQKLKGWASVDLKDVREQLAAVIEEAAANDPKTLHAKIAALEAELRKKAKVPAPAAAPPPAAPDGKLLARAIENARVEIIKAFRSQVSDEIKATETEQLAKNREAAAKLAEGVADRVVAIAQAASARFERVISNVKLPGEAMKVIVQGAKTAKPIVPVAEGKTPRPYRPMGNGAGSSPAGDTIKQTGGERRVAVAIATMPDGLTDAGVMVMCDYKATSRKTYLGKLRASGYIEKSGDRWYITDAGLAWLGDFERLPTGDALREYWMTNLAGGEQVIFQLVANAREDLSREAIEQATGYKPTSAKTYIGKLRARMLLVEGDKRGTYRAADMLYG